MEFDTLRFLSIILILLCHTISILQSTNYSSLMSVISNLFGNIGTSFFFYLSGFLIAENNKTNFSIKIFLYKRFLNIYPLYLIYILIFQNYSVQNFLIYLFGIQQILNIDPVNPLWFVSTILFYYFIFIILKKLNNIKICSLIIFSFMILLNQYANIIHKYSILYYWIFIFGIFTSEYKLFDKANYKITIIISSLTTGIFFITKYFNYLNFDSNIALLSIIFSSAAISGTFSTIYIIKKYKLFNKHVQFLSNITYPIFLFHYDIMLFFSNIINFQNNINEIFLFILIFYPIIFILGYFLYLLDNYINEKFKLKRSF